MEGLEGEPAVGVVAEPLLDTPFRVRGEIELGPGAALAPEDRHMGAAQTPVVGKVAEQRKEGACRVRRRI